MKTTNHRLTKGFGMVSTQVMKDPNLSLQEKALYAYLSGYADGGNNELFVGINKICEECSITQSTAKRILNSLVRKNVIVRQSRGLKQTSKTILLK
jgi:DNA-binding MarR family transcriptional regulator